MTRAAVQGYINKATAYLRAGRCDAAGQEIQAGYSALQDYARALAMAGASPSGTIRFHNALAKLQAKLSNQCVTDSLIAPSFSGALSYSNLFPMLGFAFAAFGLGFGIWTVYKNS